MSHMIKKAALGLLSLLLLASAASAAVLWDQSVIVPAGPGIISSNSPGFGGWIAHSVNDVTVPASGWHVTSITAWYSLGNFSWTSITQGFVTIQPKTGVLPTALPAAVQSPMSAVQDPVQSALLGQAVLAVTASVNINLPAGDYWIGIAPTAGAGISGGNRQWPSAMVGVAVATYSAPGPWTNLYPGWDSAWIVRGDETVGVESEQWSGIKSLYR